MSLHANHYFPIFLDLTNLNILIVGGGKVGTKRALKFQEYGAKVSVWSLDFSDELVKKTRG